MQGNVSEHHSPQTSPSAAQHVYMWELKWGQPACRCSHSWAGHPLLLPAPQPPEVEQRAQPEPAPSPPLGLGPLLAYEWHLPR